MTISHSVRYKPEDHHFITINDYTGDPLIIDGTWQQFLPDEQKSNDEHVLVARQSAIRAILGTAGMPSDKLKIWDPDELSEENIYWRKQAKS